MGITTDGSQRISNYDLSRKLKSLNTTRAKLLSLRKKYRIQIKDAEDNIKDVENRLAKIDKELENLDLNNDIVVSEHAILRYLMRYEGLDLDSISKKVEKLHNEQPNHVVRHGHTIVTIID